MEKIIYALWRGSEVPAQQLGRKLLDEIGPQLAQTKGVRGVRINLPDAQVQRAASLCRLTTQPPFDAVLQVWLDACHAKFRAPIDALCGREATRVAAWLVTESEVIRNRLHPSKDGTRTTGWSQVCFLQKPERLTHEQWLFAWQEQHTPIAIETQANFEYVQNLVARQLLGEPLPFSAMVEECFPENAMDDPQVFFDAVDDPEKFRRNTDAMMASCARFIDFERIDVLPTSQYVIKSLC